MQTWAHTLTCLYSTFIVDAIGSHCGFKDSPIYCRQKTQLQSKGSSLGRFPNTLKHTHIWQHRVLHTNLHTWTALEECPAFIPRQSQVYLSPTFNVFCCFLWDGEEKQYSLSASNERTKPPPFMPDSEIRKTWERADRDQMCLWEIHPQDISRASAGMLNTLSQYHQYAPAYIDTHDWVAKG